MALKRKLLGVKSDNPNMSPNIIEDFAHFVYLQRNTDVASFQEGLHYLSRAVQRSYFSAEEHESSINLQKLGGKFYYVSERRSLVVKILSTWNFHGARGRMHYQILLQMLTINLSVNIISGN